MKVRVNKFRIVLLLISLNILCCGVGYTQVGSSIQGFIFNSERRPVERVNVELLNEVNSVLGRSVTNGSGRYQFRGLSHGRYQIRVVALGSNYETQTQNVEIYGIGVSGKAIPDNKQIDIYLTARRSTEMQRNEVVFAQEVPPEAIDLYESGRSLLGKNENRDSIEKFSGAIEIFPDYYNALLGLGNLFLENGNYSQAAKVLEKCAEVNSKSFPCFLGVAIAQSKTKQNTDALLNLAKAIDIESSSAMPYLLIGLIQRDLGQYTIAEEHLLKAQELSKNQNSDVNWNLALLYYYNLNRPDKAADELGSYLKNLSEAERKNNPENVSAVKKLIKRIRSKE